MSIVVLYVLSKEIVEEEVMLGRVNRLPEERKEAMDYARVVRVDVRDPECAIGGERTGRPSPMDYLAIIEHHYILRVVHS